MAAKKYRVTRKSFINNALCDEGDIVEYDGNASDNLELVEPPPPVKEPKPVKEPPLV